MARNKSSSLRFDRGVIHDLICKKIGIPNRVKPKTGYFSKRELIAINAFIDIKHANRDSHNESSSGSH